MEKISALLGPLSLVSCKIVLTVFCFACFKIATAQPTLTFTPLLQNLKRPVEIRNAADGSGRLFIVEQGGKVKIYKNGKLLANPFLDISNIIGQSDLQGIWSIAFKPNFRYSRFFFLLYTDKNKKTELVRYQASEKNPDLADLSTKAVLLSYDGKNTGGTHYGQIHFDRAGYLYVTLSDGSNLLRTTTFAQNGTNLFGKMLRLDVNMKNPPYFKIPADNPFVTNPNVLDEIWMLGLKNAWRWSFDRGTGNMWLPDVEGEQAEELNIITPSHPAGLNFGWPCFEGNLNYLNENCKLASQYVSPNFIYLHDIPTGGQTIIGGYVYRGTASPALRGYYVCSDYGSNNAWIIRRTDSGMLKIYMQANIPKLIESYGLDESGELYAAALNGFVYKVTGTTAMAMMTSEINNGAYINENKIYPTIVRNYIMLYLKQTFQYLRITDMSGHEVLRKSLQGNTGTMQIFLPSLNTGMYIVELSGAKNIQQKIYVEQ